MWVGKINLKEGTKDDVEKVCSDIESKDQTFKWEISDNHLLISHENNRNKVYARVVWLINKVEALKGCKFQVSRA